MGGLGEQHERHVAAVRPAVHRDPSTIDPGQGLEHFDAAQLVFHLYPALLAVQGAAESGTASRRAAVVDGKHQIAVLRQVLVEEVIAATGPGAGHGLRGRATVDVDNYGGLFAGIEAGWLDQAVVQHLTVGRRQGAELGLDVFGPKAMVGMRRIVGVVGHQGGQLGAVGVEQFGLRWQRRARPDIDEHAGVGAETGLVPTLGRTQPGRLAAGQ